MLTITVSEYNVSKPRQKVFLLPMAEKDLEVELGEMKNTTVVDCTSDYSIIIPFGTNLKTLNKDLHTLQLALYDHSVLEAAIQYCSGNVSEVSNGHFETIQDIGDLEELGEFIHKEGWIKGSVTGGYLHYIDWEELGETWLINAGGILYPKQKVVIWG